MVAAKLFVLVVFVGILLSLGSAMFYLVRDKGDSDRTLKALTWRIGLSVALFASLFIAYWLGLIQPHGVTPTG
ncbi:MAG: twin transmembrane helix small protein [Gammaproteobacteria bacterium]|nr:twin transmembrane helix small protein [Gammaproteobacteria bacterium]NNF62249.1 twin transmembrane helix small protein [Gammaproteobacteria bacterium]NNM21046.1 twin transmembrane helix small protein [Gammaproteobacteria bacterium]